MRRAVHQFLILCTALMMSSVAVAQDRGPVLATIQQIPYSFIDKNGREAGYLYDVAKAILREAGYVDDVQMLPLKRMQNELQRGDVSFGILASTPYVVKHYDVVEPLGLNLDAGVLPRAGVEVYSYEDLMGLRIATPFGLKINDRFDNDSTLSKFETKDYNQSTIIMKRGRVDAIAGGVESITYNARINGYDVDGMFGTPLIFQDYEIALIKQKKFSDEKVIDRLRIAVRRLRDAGVFKEIHADFIKN
ncbi:transporter substrate-binding domain-containing protein [Terasakiella sp. A23]|uniref:substrate-binding periplasmic protein n=1 Tax=Terasakiella sp. FCG-A23 TaxID=3080561 RepID=UPI002954C797|nr:transporter substrate-binding domain-containing protein [Terasakiella sp. A23]MDV7340788.1 transporter substrate-binding domain-containing protein [Terasakiella sp. A23]